MFDCFHFALLSVDPLFIHIMLCIVSFVLTLCLSAGNLDKVNNYESGEVGGNRYATILLYMSDLGEKDGGETVFVEAWPVGQAEKDRVPMSTVCTDDTGKLVGIQTTACLYSIILTRSAASSSILLNTAHKHRRFGKRESQVIRPSSNKVRGKKPWLPSVEPGSR